MTQLRKWCWCNQYTRAIMCETVWRLQAEQRAYLKLSMEKKQDHLLVLRFLLITYVTKRGNIMRQMKYNTYKAIMFGYDKNYTRDMCKLYNQDTKNVIMSRYIKWKE